MRPAVSLSTLALLAALSSACERKSDSGATTAPSASAAPSAPADPQPSSPAAATAGTDLAGQAEPPAAFVRPMVAAEAAIEAGDYALADRQLDVASKEVGADAHLRFVLALYRATRFAYSGDVDRAAQALSSVIPEVAKHPEWPDEFSAHNQMMILRVAQGDPAAAIAEDDQATLAAARGTWAPGDRETLAYLKDRWHRAYLTRMLAETRAGAERSSLVRAAEVSLDEYRTRARKLGTNEDSIAVLEAYFAALDGKRDAALRAAKKVDPAKDGDLEDLYLVVVGLEVGGDHAAADAVRRRMRMPGDVHLARPIMLRWLELDARPPKEKSFTPWHPGKGNPGSSVLP